MLSWLISSFYHLCVVYIPHGLKRLSNSNAKTLLCSVGFCYEYLTHPSTDVWFRRIYPLLELKNHTCSCVLLRLVNCFIKITPTYSSRKMEVERRHTSPFQPSINSSLQLKWLSRREISQICLRQKETQISAQFNPCVTESTDTSRARGLHVNHVLALWLPRSGRLPPAVHQNL